MLVANFVFPARKRGYCLHMRTSEFFGTLQDQRSCQIPKSPERARAVVANHTLSHGCTCTGSERDKVQLDFELPRERERHMHRVQFEL